MKEISFVGRLPRANGFNAKTEKAGVDDLYPAFLLFAKD
jgi:hypothetical protein